MPRAGWCGIKWTANIITTMSQPPDEKEHKSTTECANRDLAPKQAIGSTSLTRPTYTGQTVWQGAIGHKRQHTAPLACICRKTSPSITQRDKILRESWGSGGLMWLRGWSADEADGNEGRRVSFSGVFLMYSCCQKSPSHPSLSLYSLSDVGVYV